MKWILEVFFIGGIVWFVLDNTQECACKKLPENYFVIETRESQMCIDENRQTHVTRIVKQGNVEFN